MVYKNKSHNMIVLTWLISEGKMLDPEPTLSPLNVTKEMISRTARVPVSSGGTWKPEACHSRWNVAIIVPFRYVWYEFKN